jgi:predicted transposase YdaD
MHPTVVYRSILAEGETRGGERKQREIASNLLRESLSIETVVRVTGLPIEEVQQLQYQLNKSAQS